MYLSRPLLIAVTVALLHGNSPANAEGDRNGSPSLSSSAGAKRLRIQQKQVAARLEKIFLEMERLIEQLQDNRLRIRSEARIKQAFSTFGEVVERTMPDVVRRVTSSSEATQREGLETQEHVGRTLSALIDLLEKSLKPVDARKALTHAVRKQKDALDRCVAARAGNPDLEGRTTGSLDDEASLVLAELAEKQKEVGEAVRVGMEELRRQASRAGSVDPREMARLRSALRRLTGNDVEREARAAARQLAENRLRGATDMQRRVLTTLESAVHTLAGQVSDAGSLETTLTALKEVRSLQVKAMNETKGMNPDDEEALSRAVRDQGQVQAALSRAAGNDVALAKARDLAGGASRDILSEDVKAAEKKQVAAIAAIDEALLRLGKERSGVRKVGHLARAEQALFYRIGRVMGEQEDLVDRTGRMSRDESHRLAGEQWVLAEKVKQWSTTTQGVDSRIDLVQPFLEPASQAMAKASRMLADRSLKDAVVVQIEALTSLSSAQSKLLLALARVAPQKALSITRYRLDVLIGAQERLMTAPATYEGQRLRWASEQNRLSRWARDQSEVHLLPKPSRADLLLASRLMKEAERALRGGLSKQAAKSQRKALEALMKAGKRLASSKVPGRSGRQQSTKENGTDPDATKAPSKPKSEFVRDRGPAQNAREPDWNIVLPPRDRHEVRQAMERKMPQAYRDHIKRYYLSLAETNNE